MRGRRCSERTGELVIRERSKEIRPRMNANLTPIRKTQLSVMPGSALVLFRISAYRRSSAA